MANEKLDGMRQEIDVIDAKMIELFTRRMSLADSIADIKRENNISLVNYEREEMVVQNAINTAYDGLRGEAVTFVRAVMALSKSRQRQKLYGNADEYYFPQPREPLTDDVKVAFQGVKGSWSEVAGLQFFSGAQMNPVSDYEDVFNAVKDEAASYGVLPIENSLTGGVGEVLDLLRKYGCYIVGQTWVKGEYCLMAGNGVGIDDIEVVYSHPKAFRQCEKFLKGRKWDLIACSDMGEAAELAAVTGGKKCAAIGPKHAAQVNGLAILTPEIEGNANEKTRYILISDTPEYDEKCDTVSVIFRTAHRSGALVDILFPLMSEDVNMKLLESRPVSDGKYCFFCDMEGNIEDESVVRALRNAASSCEYLEVLGCYKENTEIRYIM